MQMHAGGAVLLFVGSVLGEPWAFDLADVSLRSAPGLVYSIVLGSVATATATVIASGVALITLAPKQTA